MNLHGDNDHSANKKPPVKEAIQLKQLQRFSFDFRYIALYPFAVLPLPSFKTPLYKYLSAFLEVLTRNLG